MDLRAERRIVGGLLAVAAVVVAVAVPAGSAAAQPAGAGCEVLVLTLPASTPDSQLVPASGLGELLGGGEDLTISGRLCLPAGGAPETVMLALHGITYNESYWNVGFEPETYDFSRAMTGVGYAVFAIDRLGYGASTRPPSAAVTLDVQAEVTHQVITKLRDGEVGAEPFENVILVGHSYGTATSDSASCSDAESTQCDSAGPQKNSSFSPLTRKVGTVMSFAWSESGISISGVTGTAPWRL